MDAKKDATWENQLTIEIRVGRSIRSVTLQPSASERMIKITTDGETGETVWKETGSEIIRLCELGYEAERVGLTKEDIRNVEPHFVIKPNIPQPRSEGT